MSTSLSTFAILALDRLRDSYFVNWVVRGSVFDPSMGGDFNHRNRRLFGAMERYLSVQQICHAADTLNSYCESILAEVLAQDPANWQHVKTFLKGSPEKNITCLREHRQTGAREALRDGIGCFWSPESDVICKLRNKLVHQNGWDSGREVEMEVASKGGKWCEIYPADLVENTVPISYDGDRLLVDAVLAHWSTRHVQNHIYLMDQNLCVRFSLKRQAYRIRNIRYRGSGALGGMTILPGTPLPVDQTVQPSNQIKLTFSTPDYSQLMKEDEIQCGRAMLELRRELNEFVLTYCHEAGVDIRAGGGRCPGELVSHTIRGHDLSIQYSLFAADEISEEAEVLEIRIRQDEFAITVTVFSTNSLMRDFRSSVVNAEMKTHIQACVDRALR